MKTKNFFRKQIAITNEHGSWVFLLSPLVIGLFAADSWSTASIFLIFAALSAFLIRQPISISVKVYSGRRSKKDLPATWFWIIVYGLVTFGMIVGLLLTGHGYILYLAIPAGPVFIWHLYLISKRAERRQMGIELVATGILALAAPAAYWIGIGSPDATGWWLWGLTWLQSAASIVYAYLRLEQRVWKNVPALKAKVQSGRRAILYTSFNLLLVVTLSLLKILPPLLALPYLLQWLETLWGSLIKPAAGVKPTAIGFRQLGVSMLFTILFIITWM